MDFVIVEKKMDVGVLWELPQYATPRPDRGDRPTAEPGIAPRPVGGSLSDCWLVEVLFLFVLFFSLISPFD